jgi:hypothetical protein
MNNQIKERSRMYKVYWTENVTQSAQSKSFESTEMMPALAYVEVLRKQQDEDGNKMNSFVTFISENPNCQVQLTWMRTTIGPNVAALLFAKIKQQNNQSGGYDGNYLC